MNTTELALLSLAWLVGGASPGPATMALASTGMMRGRGPALSLAAGIVTGSAIWGILAALGLGTIMFANAWAAEVLRYAGAAYILWLAFKSARSALRPAEAKGVPPTDAAVKGGLRATYFGGALLHLTNPKAIFSWGAVFAIAVPHNAGFGDLALIWLLLITLSNVIFFGYALLFSTGPAMAGYMRLRRGFDAAFAVLFGGAAAAVLAARVP